MSQNNFLNETRTLRLKAGNCSFTSEIIFFSQISLFKRTVRTRGYTTGKFKHNQWDKNHTIFSNPDNIASLKVYMLGYGSLMIGKYQAFFM